MKATLLTPFVAVALALFGCATHDTAGNRVTGGTRVATESVAGTPAAPARRVYVENFGLDAEATEPRSGVLQRPRLFRELTGEDPAAHARRVVDELAASLVKNLDAAGVPAERMQPGEPLPREGWLVRGVFTEVDTGAPLRRAVIGFGSGRTDMEVQVGVSDLASRPDQSFLVFGTVTDPSRLPGGAVTRNPYVVAAKFVLAKGAPERDVQHTAKTIADELVRFRERVRAGEIKLPEAQ